MEYIHSVSLTASALAYLLLLFDLGDSSGTLIQAARIILIGLAFVLLGSLVLRGGHEVQSKVLKAVQRQNFLVPTTKLFTVDAVI